MTKAITNKLLMVLYLVLGSTLLEMICFHTLGFGLFPQYWLYNIAIVLFLAMIIFAIPNYTAQFVLSTIILFIQCILIYANYTLYVIYGGELFTFDMFKLIKEAADASNTSFFNYKLVIQLVLTFIGIFTVGILTLKRCRKNKINFKKHYAMLLVLVFAVLELMSLGTVFGYRQTLNAAAEKSEDYVSTDAFLMNTTFMKESSYRKFGTYGFYLNSLLGGYQANAEKTKQAAISYFNSGETYNSSPVFGADKKNNVIVIMMESLEWFAFGDGSYDPSLNNFSSELTPNIYNLIKGNVADTNSLTGSMPGTVAENFFAKSKTNISEGFGFMGNYPIGQQLTDIAYKDFDKTVDTFGYTLPSILSSCGYTTSFVHSHKMDYYSRRQTHKNIGFDVLFGKDDIVDEDGNQKYTGSDLDFHHWMPEEDFVEAALNYIVPAETINEGESFYTFYLNVSTHGHYQYNQDNGDQVRYKNYVMYGEDDCVKNVDGDWVLNPEIAAKDRTYSNFYQNVLNNYKDPEVQEYIANYMCGVMSLDAGVGKIIERLKSPELNVYDDTTIILYSDHYAYYNGLSYSLKGLESGDDKNSIEVNSIPFILSSPGLKKINADPENEIDYTRTDSFCSAYDIVPTILDLLGISFNQNFYIGSSLFKPLDIYKVKLNVDGEERIEEVGLKIYYSNVGGIYSQYAFTYNMQDFYFVNGASLEERDLNLLKDEAKNVLKKIYYIDLLNKKSLFADSSLTNKKFEQKQDGSETNKPIEPETGGDSGAIEGGDTGNLGEVA